MTPDVDIPLKEPAVSAAAGGAPLSNSVAASLAHRRRDLVLEHRCADWRGWNPDGLQHRLSVARVSALCRGCSFCCLRADYFVGGADVPFSPRRTNLYYAMVFARCVSLV